MLVRLGVALVCLVIVGAVYQQVGTWRDERRYPPPGRRVDIGGYSLHLNCQGTPTPRKPTVILDAIGGGSSILWAWVQPEVAASAHVCSYDRAGWGWSEDGPEPRDAAQHARELRALLTRAGVEGPFVLAGHSLGGLHMRLYADEHPEDVAGMVLVDAAYPDKDSGTSPEQRAQDEAYSRNLPMMSMMARLGVMRLFFDLGGKLDFEDLPPQQRAEMRMFWSLPRHWENQVAERAARPATDAQVKATAGLGHHPLIVLTAVEGSSSEWLALQSEMMTLSTNSVQRSILDGTHTSLTFRQDHAHATAQAILDVVAAASTGAALEP
ncbi:alpha/beta hydrolase [Chondromyces crocatus]|uniref:alpha/beta hydrolase n=1 Tax=Chondromyces crocatus TaxID=52 RepID=UPI00067CDC0D|nr:alpha/beta hydrolase [Chondromyces crocatus]